MPAIASLVSNANDKLSYGYGIGYGVSENKRIPLLPQWHD